MDLKDNMTGILFQAVARARNQAIQAELSSRGLGDLGNPMILFLLKDRGEEQGVAAQRELSDALRVSPATVAVSLKSLEKGGYVEKLPDETDQRRKGVRLTAKGEGAFHRCLQVFQAVDQRMFEGFAEDEQELLSAYYVRMIRNLRGECPPELCFRKDDRPC